MLKGYRHLVQDVTVTRVQAAGNVQNPVYSTENLQASQREFSLNVSSIGSFFVRDGREVKYSVFPGADEDWVWLYLNGQVLVALLHQRKIINFHASSFVHDGRGVMILGDTGAGKSSLTVSFVLSGAGFISDDLTPVILREGIPHLLPLNRRVKIREGTAQQLNIDKESLVEAEAGTGKKYLDLRNTTDADHELHAILRIEIGDVSEPVFIEPSLADKFSTLRSEICSGEILAGMPETEALYLQQLVKIIEKVLFVRVIRPADIGIRKMHEAVRDYLLLQV